MLAEFSHHPGSRSSRGLGHGRSERPALCPCTSVSGKNVTLLVWCFRSGEKCWNALNPDCCCGEPLWEALAPPPAGKISQVTIRGWCFQVQPYVLRWYAASALSASAPDFEDSNGAASLAGMNKRTHRSTIIALMGVMSEGKNNGIGLTARRNTALFLCPNGDGDASLHPPHK